MNFDLKERGGGKRTEVPGETPTTTYQSEHRFHVSEMSSAVEHSLFIKSDQFDVPLLSHTMQPTQDGAETYVDFLFMKERSR